MRRQRATTGNPEWGSDRWPTQLQNLCRRLQGGVAGREAAKLRAEIWLIIHYSLERLLARHSRRHSSVPVEDLQDIAAEKSLDLLERIESLRWSLEGRAPGEIVGYLSITAQNGLRDLLRRSGRDLGFEDEHQFDRATVERAVRTRQREPDSPGRAVEQREFAEALRRCVDALDQRWRRIWFFRVFYEMSSKDIARHPEVTVKASYVDVVLQRCRHAIRECMKKRGLDPEQASPRDFVRIWDALDPHAHGLVGKAQE